MGDNTILFLKVIDFIFKDEKLTLTLKAKEILSIDINQSSEREALSNQISELESSLKQPITLMKNEDFRKGNYTTKFMEDFKLK